MAGVCSGTTIAIAEELLEEVEEEGFVITPETGKKKCYDK